MGLFMVGESFPKLSCLVLGQGAQPHGLRASMFVSFNFMQTSSGVCMTMETKRCSRIRNCIANFQSWFVLVYASSHWFIYPLRWFQNYFLKYMLFFPRAYPCRCTHAISIPHLEVKHLSSAEELTRHRTQQVSIPSYGMESNVGNLAGELNQVSGGMAKTMWLTRKSSRCDQK